MTKTHSVSRETEAMLRHFTELLLKWTQRINLIAPSTEADVWQRHVMDCHHAVCCPNDITGHWVDIGSGGGLPGLIAAITHRHRLDACTLIESDQRKGAFLRTVVRDLGLEAKVLSKRVEEAVFDPADILSARALAPLPKLLDLTSAHHARTGTFLFMKGRNWQREVEEAGDRYCFSLDVRPSVTDTEGAILLISNVERRDHG